MSKNCIVRYDDAVHTNQRVLSIDSISPSPFSKLRSSIRQLQKASKALDSEKAQAEKRFKELLKKLPRKNLSYTQAVYQRITQFLKREFWFGEESPIEEFVKAAKRVQKANSKLVAFEKGFISEDGIKDREWYRHLGVAPGKWLGGFPQFNEILLNLRIL